MNTTMNTTAMNNNTEMINTVMDDLKMSKVERCVFKEWLEDGETIEQAKQHILDDRYDSEHPNEFAHYYYTGKLYNGPHVGLAEKSFIEGLFAPKHVSYCEFVIKNCFGDRDYNFTVAYTDPKEIDVVLKKIQGEYDKLAELIA